MTAYLAKGATSLASANWSDASGFSATYPDLVVNQIIGNGLVPVTSDVSHTGLTEGVFSFEIRPGARGILGSAANPLKFDADNESASAAGDQALARVTNYGSGAVLNYDIEGDNSLASNVSVGRGNTINLFGGTATNASNAGGTFFANQSTVVTNFDGYGGSSEFEYNATAITLFRAMAGTHIVRRKVTAFEIGGTAVVYYLPDDNVSSFASTSLKTTGGDFRQDRGSIPTVDALAGKIDWSKLREAIAPGATEFNLGGAKIIGSDLLDDSNIEYLYGIKRDVGGFTQID